MAEHADQMRGAVQVLLAEHADQMRGAVQVLLAEHADQMRGAVQVLLAEHADQTEALIADLLNVNPIWCKNSSAYIVTHWHTYMVHCSHYRSHT